MTVSFGKDTHFPYFWADAGAKGIILSVPSLNDQLGEVASGIQAGAITSYRCRFASHEIEGIPFLFWYILWGESQNLQFTIVLTPKHQAIVKALQAPRDILLCGALPEETEEGYIDLKGNMATIHQLTVASEFQQTFDHFQHEIH